MLCVEATPVTYYVINIRISGDSRHGWSNSVPVQEIPLMSRVMNFISSVILHYMEDRMWWGANSIYTFFISSNIIGATLHRLNLAGAEAAQFTSCVMDITTGRLHNFVAIKIEPCGSDFVEMLNQYHYTISWKHNCNLQIVSPLTDIVNM